MADRVENIHNVQIKSSKIKKLGKSMVLEVRVLLIYPAFYGLNQSQWG